MPDVNPEPRRPRPPAGAPLSATPFRRMARVHALMAAGEATMAIALADSLFLSISPGEARGRVLLFLAVSLAPFAVVAPLIGPAIDRMPGGRRLVVQIVALLRALIMILMITQLDSFVLFPLAFAALVLNKTYGVSKSALVPTVVRSEEELVEANSKLGIISGVMGFAAAVPAGLLSLVSSRATLLFGAVVFLLAFLAARQLPRDTVATTAAAPEEVAELKSTSIVLAASAMGLMRATVGFLFFHLAFWFADPARVKTRDPAEGSTWVPIELHFGPQFGKIWFGLAVSMAAIGTLVGNTLAPMIRRRVREEVMLVGALTLTAVTGLLVALLASTPMALVLAAVVNFSAATGRLGFDSIVQRNAPDANRGRAFAQFETRFQLAWVAAGIVPVLLSLPGAIGFACVGLIAAFAAATYAASLKRLHAGQPLPQSISARARHHVKRRLGDRRPRT
jgi:MFS family permease